MQENRECLLDRRDCIGSDQIYRVNRPKSSASRSSIKKIGEHKGEETNWILLLITIYQISFIETLHARK